jgi:tellurite resistance protein TehA-like permease
MDSTIFVASYMLWGIGIVLYGIFVTLFAYRIFFLKVTAADLNPLWWVIMGAAAIATNAGSTLILTPTEVPFLEQMHPFIDGTTLILWAWGTWWIPLLIIIGFWRHVVWREPLRYHPTYWNLVFPLGMYTVATYRLGLAADFPPLRTAPHVLIWIAFTAWSVTMFGLLRSLVRAPGQQQHMGLD